MGCAALLGGPAVRSGGGDGGVGDGGDGGIDVGALLRVVGAPDVYVVIGGAGGLRQGIAGGGGAIDGRTAGILIGVVVAVTESVVFFPRASSAPLGWTVIFGVGSVPPVTVMRAPLEKARLVSSLPKKRASATQPFRE